MYLFLYSKITPDKQETIFAHKISFQNMQHFSTLKYVNFIVKFHQNLLELIEKVQFLRPGFIYL